MKNLSLWADALKDFQEHLRGQLRTFQDKESINDKDRAVSRELDHMLAHAANAERGLREADFHLNRASDLLSSLGQAHNSLAALSAHFAAAAEALNSSHDSLWKMFLPDLIE